MIIRPVKGSAEIEAAFAIESVSYPPEAAATRDAFYERSRKFPGYFLVGEEGGTIGGVTNGVRLAHSELADDAIKQMAGYDEAGAYFCILTVAVRPDFRRRGLGRLLVRGVVEQARRDRLTGVVLMCERELVPFYESLSFRYVRPSDSTHGGITWHEMRLDL